LADPLDQPPMEVPPRSAADVGPGRIIDTRRAGSPPIVEPGAAPTDPLPTRERAPA
jgi:hypothetical protein